MAGMSDPSGDYTGTDNLEIMSCAVNYNAYLLGLVEREARPGMALLDFGAGIGTFAARLGERGHQVLCIEPDARQAAMIEARGLRNHRALADCAPESIDLAYSFNVFEHIEADVQAMAELRRVLKPGGRLLAYVPALQWLYTSMDAKVGHVRRYTRASLQGALSEAGFTVQHCHYADSVGVAATLAYKLFGRADGAINEQALKTYDRFVFPLSRWIDRATGRVGGKNVWALAQR